MIGLGYLIITERAVSCLNAQKLNGFESNRDSLWGGGAEGEYVFNSGKLDVEFSLPTYAEKFLHSHIFDYYYALILEKVHQLTLVVFFNIDSNFSLPFSLQKT